MTLLVLGAKFGDEVIVSSEGKDEEAALTAICDLFNNKFDEEE